MSQRAPTTIFTSVDLSPQTYHSFNGGGGGAGHADEEQYGHHVVELPPFTRFQRRWLYPLTHNWLFEFSSKEDDTRTNLDSWIKIRWPHVRRALKQIVVSICLLVTLYICIYRWTSGVDAMAGRVGTLKRRSTHVHKNGLEYFEYVPKGRNLYRNEVEEMKKVMPFRDVTVSEIDAQHADIRLPWYDKTTHGDNAIATINFTLAKQVMHAEVSDESLMLLCTGLPHFGVPLRVFYTAEQSIILNPTIVRVGELSKSGKFSTPFGIYSELEAESPSWMTLEYIRLDTGLRDRVTIRDAIAKCMYMLIREADNELVADHTHAKRAPIIR